MRPNDWRPTTAYGSAATREATCHRCGRTPRPSSATSRRDPICPRPASPIASPGRLAGSPASIARRGIISKGRLPCSNPAATTIWPFASDRTQASAQWSILAIVSWPLGEVDRAISLVDRMQTRIADLTHVGTLAFGKMHAALFELMRGDRMRAAPNAFELARLAREHELPMWRSVRLVSRGLGGLFERRARRRARGHAPRRRATCEQNVLFFDGLLKIALAEAEAEAGDLDRASRSSTKRWRRPTARAIAHSKPNCIGRAAKPCSSATPPIPHRQRSLPDRHRRREQQGTRSFELRAALALAKLYQSTARPVEAHGVLAPALKGFSPTPEMPEIAEAQALLSRLP